MVLKIKGPIVPNDYAEIYDWIGMECTSPAAVEKAIAALAEGEDLEVEINSGGGDVFSGSEIYALLKNLKQGVIVRIMGIAASAASVVAMAGDVVGIAPTAQIMIHNVASIVDGDCRAHNHEAEVLKNYNKSIANAYRLKTGMAEKDLLAMMDKETWLNAKDAKEKGFVDEILFDDDNRLVAGISVPVLSQQAVQQVKALINKTKDKSNEVNRAKLSLLKMKGVQ